jgi:hypothetical protein
MRAEALRRATGRRHTPGHHAYSAGGRHGFRNSSEGGVEWTEEEEADDGGGGGGRGAAVQGGGQSAAFFNSCSTDLRSGDHSLLVSCESSFHRVGEKQQLMTDNLSSLLSEEHKHQPR